MLVCAAHFVLMCYVDAALKHSVSLICPRGQVVRSPLHKCAPNSQAGRRDHVSVARTQ